jgi:hypothetical protein
MLDVMRVDKTRVVTTGKRTAFVPGYKGTFDGRWHGAGLATDIQRFPVLVFTDNHRRTVASHEMFRAMKARGRSYSGRIAYVLPEIRAGSYGL